MSFLSFRCRATIVVAASSCNPLALILFLAGQSEDASPTKKCICLGGTAPSPYHLKIRNNNWEIIGLSGTARAEDTVLSGTAGAPYLLGRGRFAYYGYLLIFQYFHISIFQYLTRGLLTTYAPNLYLYKPKLCVYKYKLYL